MTPEELSIAISTALGVILSLVFSYWPAAKAWLDAREDKRLIMLGFCVVLAAGWYGLSLTPLAAQLGIAQMDVFVFLRALFLIASGSQLTYLLSPRK